MRHNQSELIDNVFEGFSLENTTDSVAVEKSTITLWVDKEYKEKFDDLQNQTKKLFGKKVQELLKKAIDKYAK